MLSPETLSMVTQDGIRLDADVYRPPDKGEYPVLLMRQPYGRAIASTVVYAHPRWYAAQGYIVVIQDVRGRGTSTGSFDLFRQERSDGWETVNWAAALPGSNGRVGMYGFSYQGLSQLYAAAARPKALQALSPAMTGYDLYADWAYEGGAFCLQSNLGWAIQLAAETARLKGDEPAFTHLVGASRQLPLQDPIPADPDVFKTWATDSFYRDWLNHPDPGEYWDALKPDLTEVDLPMLHVGGWFDPFLRGTIRLYQDRIQARKAFQALWIGPWGHLPWNRKVGVKDFGPQAVNPIDRLQIRWFDHWLKDIDTGILTEDPVHLFEMGGNRWQSFLTWPDPTPTDWYLSSRGLAGMSEAEGHLQIGVPDSETADVWVHDPWRPVPTLGGHHGSPSGVFDRSGLDGRSDILTYTTAPLDLDLHLAGSVSVELWCEADCPSFDLCAVLSEVTPNGSVYNLSQGYRRLNTPEDPVRIELQATCARVVAGHRLRLSISAASFPAFPVNPGTGSQPAQTTLIEAGIITVTLYSGGSTPSRIRLPVVAGE